MKGDGSSPDPHDGVQVDDANSMLHLALVGQAPWRAALGHGTFATFDLGEQVPGRRADGRPTGAVHLWVEMASWRVREGSTIVGGSSDEEEAMTSALASLEGVEVVGAHVHHGSLDLALQFAGSIWLETFRSSSSFDQWSLHTPTGVLFADGGPVMRFEPSA